MNSAENHRSTPDDFNHWLTDRMIQQTVQLADACCADAIFYYLDASHDRLADLQAKVGDHKIVLVTHSPDGEQALPSNHHFVRVPNVPLTRMGQVKLAILLAASRGMVEQGDIIVSLTGSASRHCLDTLTVSQVDADFEVFNSARQVAGAYNIDPEVIERVVDIASELGHEGREGKPVGALFVIGDADAVLSRTRQLILNPVHGYPEQQRNLLAKHLEETVKELASLDGAFVVRSDGVIETAGAFLRNIGDTEINLPPGLGARHHAAATVTATTNAIAVTVSESTGTVTLFRKGKIVTQIEKPRLQHRDREMFVSLALSEKDDPPPPT